jgi:hypothetical protein
LKRFIPARSWGGVDKNRCISFGVFIPPVCVAVCTQGMEEKAAEKQCMEEKALLLFGHENLLEAFGLHEERVAHSNIPEDYDHLLSGIPLAASDAGRLASFLDYSGTTVMPFVTLAPPVATAIRDVPEQFKLTALSFQGGGRLQLLPYVSQENIEEERLVRLDLEAQIQQAKRRKVDEHRPLLNSAAITKTKKKRKRRERGADSDSDYEDPEYRPGR